jgi:hypothetical protein
VKERTAQHRKVSEKLDALRAKRVELARQLAESERIDRENAEQAALEGKAPARRQKTASLRGRLEDCDREISGFEDGVAKSADALLAAAGPHAVAASEKAAEAREAAIARMRELFAAADHAAEEVANLHAEIAWLRRLDGQHRRVEPFRPSAGIDPAIGQLRGTVRDALAEWEAKDAQRRAEAERQRRWNAEEAARAERGREQALREDAEARVRYEGMKLVERGGRPVGPGGFQSGEEETP